MPSRVLPAILTPQKGRSLAIGFYTNWDGDGEAQLRFAEAVAATGWTG